MAGQDSLVVKLSLTSRRALTELSYAAQKPMPVIEPAPTKMSSYFTQSQLALALTIQKVKPRGLSTSDFCQQLRNHINIGQSTAKDQLRYVDTSEFWKDQYTSILVKNKTLEDKFQCLEEAQRLSHDQSSIDEGIRQVYEADNLRVMEPGISKKRLAITRDDEPPPDPDKGTASPSVWDDSILRLSSCVVRIKRQRNLLEAATKDSSTLDQITELSNYILQALDLIEDFLPACCLPLHMLKDSEESFQSSMFFQHVMHQIGLTFLACFNGMNELCRTILGRSKKHEIVYRLVMFMSKSLDLLHTISTTQAESEMFRKHQSCHKRPRIENTEFVVNKYLSKTIASILHSLDWQSELPGHCEILEGILFCILENIGRRVSEAAFGEHVALSNNPGNITNNVAPMTQITAKYESRYIVQILHAAIGGSTRNDSVAQILAGGKSSSKAQVSFSGIVVSGQSGDLLRKAKRLLRDTLMKSTLGEANALEVLRLPTPPVEGMTSQSRKDNGVEQYGPEWLVETVWALVGWDVPT